MNPGELWRSAINTAFLAGKIAREKVIFLKDIAFTASVVHDIGKVIFGIRLLPYFTKVMERVNEKKMNFNQAAKEVMEFDHSEIGTNIAEKGKFPAGLIESVRRHHLPGSASEEHKKLVSIVHISGLVCLCMGIGLGADGLHYTMDQKAVDLLKITEKDMENFFKYVVVMQDTVEQFIS